MASHESDKTLPTDAAVREAMEYLEEHLAFEADRTLSEDQFMAAVQTRIMRFAKHFRTLLSYVRAAQAQRLTGERLGAVKHAATQLDWYCQHLNDADSKAADRLRAAFPELGEG